MIYFCCDDERRRNEIKDTNQLNGIDFLEVVDNASDPYELRQRTLLVHFINGIGLAQLGPKNVQIQGGERIRNIHVINASVVPVTSPPSPPSSPPETNVLVVEVKEPGDFSLYTLRLVKSLGDPYPPDDFDIILSAVNFSFKVQCPTDFDCKPSCICPPEERLRPEINYLAKDYSSFRQLILDRLSTLVPDWRERNSADLGVALVELLAYVGDYLSYRQDAIGTEAYLNTARNRISIRRHARLVDYFMHDGCNARVWMHVRVKPGAAFLLQKGSGKKVTKFLTRVPGLPRILSSSSSDYTKALISHPKIFELMDNFMVNAQNNEFYFYTYGSQECCLPKGATRATLRGECKSLKAGHILILAEVLGPGTGKPEDADPSRRHAVCIREIRHKSDPLRSHFESSDETDPSAITEIEWDQADALPFPICISVFVGNEYYENVSVAFGNIVLADHGLTMEEEGLGQVPVSNPALTKVPENHCGRCDQKPPVPTRPRFHPSLKYSPLTQTSFDPEKPLPSTAQEWMKWSMRAVLPAIRLHTKEALEEWKPVRDLLKCDPNDTNFVVETDRNGTAYLRFGDDQFGLFPASGTEFTATYRIGNGIKGNVGADSLFHIVSDDQLVRDWVLFVTNLLPATGGVDPEPMERVQQDAPSAFQVQERAVTAQDYAEVAKRCEMDIQRAAATFRWTGSWRTVFLTVDRKGGAEINQEFEKKMRNCMERYRMAGQDLEVDGPNYVSLEIEMVVCVKRNYLKSDVKAALLEIFSNRSLRDGRRGVFHPDHFTFGQTVFLSSLYAAAQSTEGVDSVDITKFQRQGTDNQDALKSGKLELGRLEIARLDNDRNFPERGIFHLIVKGGR